MAAGFPGNSQGIALTDKGGPQVQSPMGAYIASRAGLGGFGGGFTYGPTSPYKKRGYQLTRPGGGGIEGPVTGGSGGYYNPYSDLGGGNSVVTGPPGGSTTGGGGDGTTPIRKLIWGDARGNGTTLYIPGMDQYGTPPPRNIPPVARQQQIVNAATNARNARPMMTPMTTGFGDTGTSSPDIIRRFLMAKGLM